MKKYYRPLIQIGKNRSLQAFELSQTPYWFDHLQVFQRDAASYVTAARSVPTEIIKKICKARKNPLLFRFSSPIIMGVLNLTPDSFSDGGKHSRTETAVHSATSMVKSGARIIDIGAESTRPGSDPVDPKTELRRLKPILKEIRNLNLKCIWSVDTRKSLVMERAIKFGVTFINDISALSYDKDSVKLLAKHNALICLMHGGENPKTMQHEAHYDNVLLDVYDFLDERVKYAEKLGIKKSNIIVDPGIGFKKTMAQNLILIKNASLFHSLGCPVLFGVSRKGFLGHLTNVKEPDKRVVGSVAAALDLIGQGVHVVRVHDVEETKQAVAIWKAINV